MAKNSGYNPIVLTVAGGALALGGWYLFSAYKKKPSVSTAKGVPHETQSPSANPAHPAVSASMHDVAAALLERAKRGLSESEVSSEAHAFQQAYNQTNPKVTLSVDGKYGPKTQAALQSVISPAGAPPALSKHGRVQASPVAPPADVAAEPDDAMSQDIQTSAANLSDFFASGAAMGSFTPVATFQRAWNQVKPNDLLVENGQYGPKVEAALNAVISYYENTQGLTMQPAPANPYGAVKDVFIFP